ncbi:hypothetical protein [Burkholderia ubonensis]|uniref:hypothetical protein n=1 Tax=Burkholderia ubonensis TaxID=101571 RepID=UPI0012FBFF26|nr:hypothetical protein [Burkholderia ubonensis]
MDPDAAVERQQVSAARKIVRRRMPLRRTRARKRERDSDWFRTPEEMCDRTRSGSSPDMFERKRPARGSSISTRGDFSELYYFRRPDARLSSSKTGVEMREILNHADARSI